MREFNLSIQEMNDLTLFQFQAMAEQLQKESEEMNSETGSASDTKPKAVYKVTSAEDTRRLIEGLQAEGIHVSG